MRTGSSESGFSLVEVATSIGVIAFALVALLGVFPLGLENARLCVGDSRATQLMQMVSATLQSEPFTESACFSPDDPPLAKLNYTAIGSGGADGENRFDDDKKKLYVSYDVNALPRMVRAQTPPAHAIYLIELRFRKQVFTPVGLSSAQRVIGTNVNLRIFGLREKKPFSESWIYLTNIPRT